MNIGDTVKFTGYCCDYELILGFVHGWAPEIGDIGKIVNQKDDHYLIEYQSSNGDINHLTRLGFLPRSFEVIDSATNCEIY